MTLRQFKTQIFVLEGFNAFATGLYFNWIFFFTQNRLQFGVVENLALVALHGIIYTGAAWFGGWFAHRHGSFNGLKIGFAIMGVALALGTILPSALAQIFVIVAWTLGMCFTWPTLQSLISDGEASERMPRLAGIYNVVWSGVSAISYFIGGALLEKLGIAAIFWIPALIHLVQLVHVCWLEKNPVAISPVEKAQGRGEAIHPAPGPAETDAARFAQKKFLRYALLANPMAYVAINTVIPMIPIVAQRFALSPTMIGVFCSIWFFVRMAAFVLFWLWPGWHYRFGFLLAAKIFLIASLLGLLLAPAFWILLVAQIFFGLSVGLIYYSSLYYSMHGGTAKSEHSGAHEAMIGLGTLLGAGVGVSAKLFFPHVAGVSIWAVSGLLLAGLFGLIWLRYGKENG